MSAEASSAPAPAVDVNDPAVLSRRIFCGNLTFQTRDTELKAFCEKVGPVSECKIIFRGPRSLGYGFVTFEKDSDAVKALEALNGAELDTRNVKIEMASPRVPREESAAASGETGQRRRRGSNAGRKTEGGERRPRQRRPARDHEGEEKSKTTLFVGNLPFSVVDEDLYNIFQAYTVEKAYVVRRFNGASRGYGFVVMSEADQTKALAEMGTVICDDRTLIIRAAYEDTNKEKKTEEAADAE